jgi:hypothetical protein
MSRAVVVIGATVSAFRKPMAEFRVRISTGRHWSGAWSAPDKSASPPRTRPRAGCQRATPRTLGIRAAAVSCALAQACAAGSGPGWSSGCRRRAGWRTYWSPLPAGLPRSGTRAPCGPGLTLRVSLAVASQLRPPGTCRHFTARPPFGTRPRPFPRAPGPHRPVPLARAPCRQSACRRSSA